jgi:hypothetical protein
LGLKSAIPPLRPEFLAALVGDRFAKVYLFVFLLNPYAPMAYAFCHGAAPSNADDNCAPVAAWALIALVWWLHAS